MKKIEKKWLLAILSISLALTPGSWAEQESQLAKATELFKNGDSESVIRILEDPDSNLEGLEAKKLLAAAKFNVGKVMESEKIYEQLVTDGHKASLVGLGFSKVELQKKKWLAENQNMLLKELETNPDLLRVFILWSLRSKDLRPLEKALEVLDDETIVKNPQANLTLLKAYRIILNRAIANGRGE